MREGADELLLRAVAGLARSSRRASSSTTVEFRHHGSRIASHERCYSRLQKIFDLEHYLDVLDRKPGALRGSTPLAQWRAQGRWPESYDRLWEQLTERYGRQAGTRAMVTLIRMGGEFGYAKLATAVEQALDLGCGDIAAIRHLLLSDQLQHAVGEPDIVSDLLKGISPLIRRHRCSCLKRSRRA